MERRKEKEHSLSLFETVIVGNEEIQAGVYDQYTEGYKEVGRRKQKRVTLRRVDLQKEYFNPDKTPILINFHIKEFDPLDKILESLDNPNNKKAKWEDYDFSEHAAEGAAWRNAPYHYFYRNDPRRKSHFLRGKKPEPVTVGPAPQEEPKPNIVRELCNRKTAEGSGCAFTTALRLSSIGTTAFCAEKPDTPGVIYSTRDLTSVWFNPQKSATLICSVDPDKKLLGFTYLHSETQFTTIRQDEHPAVLEAERILAQH